MGNKNRHRNERLKLKNPWPLISKLEFKITTACVHISYNFTTTLENEKSQNKISKLELSQSNQNVR
jgi:hypothetical protein